MAKTIAAREPHPLFQVRSAGVLLHPTSLSGPQAIGDLGPSAHAFVDWLAAAGQRWWQMLPVHPPGSGGSPYSAPTAFAGDPLLISLESLVEDGLLARDELPARRTHSDQRIDHAAAHGDKLPCLRRAFDRWYERRGHTRRAFLDFCASTRFWLEDHALFSALKGVHENQPWTEWSAGLRDRKATAIREAREDLAGELLFHEFLQYLFERQWSKLRSHAARRGVRLLGDLPIFVIHDSTDVWAHPELFRLDRRGRLEVQTGVPPDYFSSSGQLWGHPHYRWESHARSGFRWWRERIGLLLVRFDAVRIDHFIGFHRAWEVSSRARTARRGRWREAAGRALLQRLERDLGPLPLVAEDLGLATEEVYRLRDDFALPGMRVLQFGFGESAEEGRYHQPHNHAPNTIVYTGTHDNDTSRGWFRSARRKTRARVQAYCGGTARTIHRDLLRLAYASPARTAIIPMQDLLGLGSRARMNTPATVRGNWSWRLPAGACSTALAGELQALCHCFERHLS